MSDARVDLAAIAAAMCEAMDQDLDDGAIWAEVDGVVPSDYYDEPASLRLAEELGLVWDENEPSRCLVLSHAGMSAQIWWDPEAERGRWRIVASGRDVARVYDPTDGRWRLEIREG